MGSVFRARRADGAYEREVAIKLLPWSLRDEETERRFARECQLLAGLNHPGIAQLLDGGRTADGSPFLVMELVRGQSLLDYCDNRRLGLHARLELFGRLLTVVEFAHRHLIIHRDIKPANLLVTDDGQIKLLDFGIARLADTSEPSEPSELTRNLGQRLTPDYAAPAAILWPGGHHGDRRVRPGLSAVSTAGRSRAAGPGRTADRRDPGAQTSRYSARH